MNIEKIHSIVRNRQKKSRTVHLNAAEGPESPLTPQLLEGNAKFDKYMESKIMVWHKNRQRDITT